MHKIQRIILTVGEPAGIGPDLVVQIAQRSLPAEIVAIADKKLLINRAQKLNKTLVCIPYDEHAEIAINPPGAIKIIEQHAANNHCCGRLDPANAGYVIHCIKEAVRRCERGEFTALVTGPVHKGIINRAGIEFSGHTELLAQLTHCKHVVMMLASDALRVALLTTHLALADVPRAITKERLQMTLNILIHNLQKRFGISSPRILVCGLNPHAGEGGFLGREEIDIIAPVIRHCQNKGLKIVGPLPADSLFTPAKLATADAVLAMYHDQGLPVLKYQGFGSAVNITLGLPIIRTSVDHGTALDLAGTGRADETSLLNAIVMAVALT